jgi:hypothetical protein
MRAALKRFVQRHRGALLLGAGCFALGVVVRHEIGWLWANVFFYPVMILVAVVVVGGYVLFMGDVADDITQVTPNSPDQVRLREMLLNQDQPRRN